VGLWASNNHVYENDDGVDESRSDSFAHQKSKISGDGVSPPYCATRPSACVAAWGRGLTACIPPAFS